MTEIPFVLTTLDLDVFGGPSFINVSTDFGKAGARGSRIWVGNGNPAVTLTSQNIALYDLYINTNANDQFYSWLYQYVPEVGSPEWVRVLKLNPSQQSKITATVFDDGVSEIKIPLADIMDIRATPNPTVDKFIIRYDFENSSGNPVSSSFTSEIQTILSVKYLTITISAIEYNGSTWQDLSGSQKVHTFISYLS
jgi:hypothetical protein